MDAVVQWILDRSVLDVTLINITNATEDSFTISIESRVTGTGPVPAKIMPMEVDLTFNGASFGKLKLPAVETSPSGCSVNIYDQQVPIVDKEAFVTFVKALMCDDKLTLTLDNGKCTITAFRFLKAHCTYKKDVHLEGMKGLATRIMKTTSDKNTIMVTNPSPVYIDHGISTLELQADGQTIAELKGPMVIQRGDHEVTMDITRKSGALPDSDKVRLVGIGVEGNAWTKDTVKNLNVPVSLSDEFRSFYQSS